MKKHNGISSIVFICIFFFITVFGGCKSTPSKTVINPIDLLSQDNDIYIVYPKSVDEEFLSDFLEYNVNGISSKDLSQIVQRVDTVYAGIKSTKRSKSIQAVITGKIPSGYLNHFLTNSKQWNNREYVQNSGKKYKLYDYDDYTICIPDSSMVLAGSNIEPLVQNYDAPYHFAQENSGLNSEVYEYLEETQNSVRFYIASNSISNFFGMNGLNFSESFLFGEFYPDESDEKNYILNMDLVCNSDKIVKSIKAFFSLMFGFSGNKDVSVITENRTLKIRNLSMEKQEVRKLLIN